MTNFDLLTPIQTDIYLDESKGTAQNYGIGVHCRVTCAVNATALQWAVTQLEQVVYGLCQRIRSIVSDTVSAPCIDFRTVHQTDNPSSAVYAARVEQWVKQSYDLTGPLIRVIWVQVADQTFDLVIGSHHILLDGESIVAFSKALVDLALQRKTIDEVLAEQKPYDRFATQLTEQFDSEKTLAFWRSQAAWVSSMNLTHQPIDQGQQVQLVDHPIRGGDAIRGICKQLSITEAFYFKCLFAFVAGELYGLDGSVTISEVISHRQKSLGSVLGSFSSFVPFVVTQYRNYERFDQLVKHAREFQRMRKGHELISQFESRRIGMVPEGVRLIFNFHGYSKKMMDSDELQFLESFTNEDPNAIQFYVYLDANNALRGKCSHPHGPDEAQSFLERIQWVNDQLLTSSLRLADLALVTDSERETIQQWNATEQFCDEAATLHGLFERKAAECPNEIAVVFEDEALTFRELNQRANRVAHYLRAQGVETESLVGIYLNRSLDMLVGVLGILKAGAAYVPLDTDYPDARIRYMVANANTRWILTQTQCHAALHHLLNDGAVTTLALNDAALLKELASYSDDNLDPRSIGLSARNLAYVIYTSGSTGNPKGVMLEHRGVVSRIAWMQSIYQLDVSDSILQQTSFGFDVSVWELFWGIQVGAKTVFAKPGGHKDPDYVCQLIENHQITVAHFIPSMLRLFIERDQIDRAKSLKHIICSGEALPASTYNDTVTRLSTATVSNIYGPTEVSIYATYWQGKPGQLYDTIPIGQPIDNTECLIVNSSLKQLPIGAAGELCIGGVGLARGYLGRAELTAEKFITHPFKADERLYRTGDLVRYLPDGMIEYLGRMDDQVKIRGFRIELGEIEQQITQLPNVQTAVVIARADATGQKRLLAYLTKSPCEHGNPPADAAVISEIRTHLHNVLPDYMMPAAFTVLDAIPLSPNGKTDRKALPDPILEATVGEYMAPSTPTEQQLAAIWSTLLNVPQTAISATANFFELGGHSLLAIRLLSALREHLGVEISIRDVFNTPQLSALAERIQSQSAPPQRLSITPIPRSSATAKVSWPASFAQQRLWLLDKLEGGSVHYNMPVVLRVTGNFNVAMAERALQCIVDRHEPLRTVFAQVQDEVHQVVHSTVQVYLPDIDLCHLSEPMQAAAVAEAIDQDAQKPFDLSQDLMLRASFLRTANTDGWLLFNMHHIASDGWSMGVLIDEFVQLYDAFVHHQPNPLPELPLQYSDYAYWQQQWIRSDAFAEQRAYWETHLAELPQVHSLPLDHARSPIQLFAGAHHHFAVDASLTAALKEVGLSRQATLFMVLHGAFAVLLSRYSDHTDIVIGTPVANRLQKELEPLVGCFVNSLVLRVQCSPDASFNTFLDHVKAINVSAQANQDVPFEHLVEILNPNRSTQHTPLFQIMFSMDTEDHSAVYLSGVHFSRVIQHPRYAKFELLLNAVETADGIRFVFEYNRDIFDASTIARMADHLTTLLHSIAAQPETPLAELPMLLPDELHWLCHDLNATAEAYPQMLHVHELVEHQVKATPNRVAVVCGEQRMTYQTLDQRANQLAHHLRAHGVQANRFVGLCLPRSLDMVVGLLAILKAGGAYVPIDPTYPEERVAYMIQDSGIDCLISHTSVLARFNHLPETATVLCLDNPVWIERISEAPNTALPPLDLTPDRQLMYAIYTSGSTGRPKAAQVYHRGAVNLLHWYFGRVSTAVPDCVLLISSLSFDLTQKNIWSPLMLGGTLVLMEGDHYDADRIITSIEQSQVTRITCTPSVFYPLVEHPAMWPSLSSLRQVYLGGEPIAMSRLQAWHEQSTCELINYYGPTECTDMVSYHIVQPGELNPPIGRPINNMELYVLNKRQSPTPLGSVGELYIGGDGVGAGYLGRAELTAEKFIAHPFKAGERLYRTGDLARYLPDGTIEYLGRIDDQVKIRGFRIELGEIEQQISQLPSIKDSVVLAKDNANGLAMLVAYVTLYADYRFDEDAIRTQLAQSLPDYMMPTFFVALDQFPLTPNGKVNKQVLLQRQESVAVHAERIAPRNIVEQQIHDIFCEVLGLDAVSVTANFFDLGGHSLLATQVISRLRRCYTRDIPVALLFEQPTVSRLAKTLADFAAASIEEPNHPDRLIHRRTPSEQPPLSYAQQRLWFLHQLEPTSAAYNIFGAFRVVGSIDASIFQDAIETVVARHEILRTTFSAEGVASQTILDRLDVPLYAIDLQSLTPEAQTVELDRLIDAEANRPFNLASEPLIRFTLIALSTKDSVLLINLHHIIADGWSLSVLIQEITHLYRDRGAQHHFSLPDLPIQYADYAQWQHTRLQGEQWQLLTDYWTRQLAGDLPTLELPVDFARAERSTHEGGSVSVSIDTALTDKLQVLCKREEVSLFMLLYTTYCVLLNRLSRQDDIIVGTPIAGRYAPETEALIGCFVNTLALRLNLSGAPTFKDLLLRAKDVCIGAYEHQEMPFDKLVEILRPDRSLNQNPIFSVMINLVNTPSLDIQIDGLAIEEITQPAPQSKLALTLYAFERGSQLDFKFVYQKDLYSDERMAAFAEQFVFLLTQVTDAISLPISRYSLVPPAHQQRLPNPKSELAPVNLTPLPEQLHSAIIRFANNKALLHRHRHYTYRELGESSRAIATHLVQQSVAPGEVVAVFGERSFSLVSSMVAVLSIGGVLMTIDKNTPEMRRRATINESGARTLIVVDGSDTMTAEVVRDHDWQQVVRIDPATGHPTQATDAYSPEIGFPQVSLDDPAYIFFTSGTTGKPKGILGQHKGLSQFLSWQQAYFSIDESDRAAQLTSLNFDVVLRDIFLPLISGATLCLPDQEDDLSAATLFPWFQQQRITYLHTVPTIAKSWLADSTYVESLPNLRRVFFAGEPLPSSLVQQWRERIGCSQLVNLYGPAETTLAKAFHIVEANGRLPAVIPVGTAIPGTQLLVINAEGALCGVGEQGEVVIRTRYATLGYLDSGWSSSKFQIGGDPDAPNDVIYFTGDIGYYRPDGQLCIAGRLDDQIKIRGIRIELGEIQAVVNHHPQVKEVALTTFAGTTADKRIAAYYVTDYLELDALTLRGYVKERLPDYMVPSVFIQVPALPFTLNGKLDRRKLPDPLVVQQAEQKNCYVPPTSQLEEILVSIWASLLNSAQVGIDDNFFDLGGHSLLLMQVKSQLKEQLSLDVPVIVLFQHPTIRALARYFNQENQETVSFEEVEQRVSRRKSSLQHRLRKRLSQS